MALGCLAEGAAAVARIYAHGQVIEAHAGVGGQACLVGGSQSAWKDAAAANERRVCGNLQPRAGWWLQLVYI